MDNLRQWALCLIIAGVAGTLAIAISPRGVTDKTVKAIVGIFVVSVICSPLTDMKNMNISSYAFANYDYKSENESGNLDEYMLDVCRDTVEKHIYDLAEEMNLSIDKININMNIDADSCIIIHDISVALAEKDREKSAEFNRELSNTLGLNVG